MAVFGRDIGRRRTSFDQPKSRSLKFYVTKFVLVLYWSMV